VDTKAAIPPQNLGPKRRFSTLIVALLAISFCVLSLVLWLVIEIGPRIRLVARIERKRRTVSAEPIGPRWLTDHVPTWYASSFGRIRFLPVEEIVLDDSDRSVISQLPDLNSLWLRGDEASGKFLSGLRSGSRLEEIGLCYEPIPEDGLRHISTLKSLQRLSLHMSPITDADLSRLGPMPGLRSIYIFTAPNVTDTGIGHIAKMKDVERLDLHEVAITDISLVHIASMTSIKTVDMGSLASLKITDAGLKHLQGKTSLIGLGIDGSSVTDAGLVHLVKLKNLQELGLGSTAVSDAGLATLSGLTNLEYLNLRGTKVTDVGLEQLKGLTHLSRLELTGTAVTPAGADRLKKGFPRLTITR
jgi:Leucine-rich repeat (LRR) protein